MKVTGQQPPKTPELQSGQTREAEQQAQRAKGRSAESPGPARSRTSLTTAKVREAIRNTPDVRADRVAEARKRIAEGRYEVDSARVAERMLNDALREDIDKP